MWARLYETHTADNILDMFKNHLTSIFGNPATAYSDKGSQDCQHILWNFTDLDGQRDIT